MDRLKRKFALEVCQKCVLNVTNNNQYKGDMISSFCFQAKQVIRQNGLIATAAYCKKPHTQKLSYYYQILTDLVNGVNFNEIGGSELRTLTMQVLEQLTLIERVNIQKSLGLRECVFFRP